MSGFFGYLMGSAQASSAVVVEEVDDPEIRERRERLQEKMAETIAPTVVAYRDISKTGGDTLNALRSGATFDAVMRTIDLFCWESYSAIAEAHSVVSDNDTDGKLGLEWYCSTNVGTELHFRHGSDEVTETESECDDTEAVAKRNNDILGPIQLPKDVGEFYFCVQKHCYRLTTDERDNGHSSDANAVTVRDSCQVVNAGDYDEVAFKEEYLISGLPHLFYMKEHVHRVLAMLHSGGGYKCAHESSEALKESFRASFPVVTQWCSQLLRYDDIELVQDLSDDDSALNVRRLNARMPINEEFVQQRFPRVASVVSGVTDLSINIMDKSSKKSLGVYRVSNMVASFDAVLHNRTVVWTDAETGAILYHEDGSLQTVDWNEKDVFEAVVVVRTALKMFWMSPTIHFPETHWHMRLEAPDDLENSLLRDFSALPFISDSCLKERVLQAQRSAGGQRYVGAAQLNISVTHIGHIPGEGLVSWVLPVEAFKQKILKSLYFTVCSLPHETVPQEPFTSIHGHPIATLWTTIYLELPKLPSMLSGIMKIFASMQWIQNVLSIGIGLCSAIVTDFGKIAEKLSGVSEHK